MDAACCVLLGSMAALRLADLRHADVVLASVSLPDGTGLDALAHVREHRPELPVILRGWPADAALAVEAIRGGALDFMLTTGEELRALPLLIEKCLTHHRMKLENERLQRVLGRSLADLGLRNRQLKAVIRQLEMMARTDELTGLCNRRWLDLMLERIWTEANRNDTPLAFMMIDLDGFKNLNDRMGHQRGDDLLKLTGRIIDANCRQADVAGRYGGDEFAIVMPHTRAHEAVQVAGRILEEFDRLIASLPEQHPSVGVSIGISHVDLSRPGSADQLVHHADEAMYAAKSAGRQRLMVRDRAGITSPAPFQAGILDPSETAGR